MEKPNQLLEKALNCIPRRDLENPYRHGHYSRSRIDENPNRPTNRAERGLTRISRNYPTTIESEEGRFPWRRARRAKTPAAISRNLERACPRRFRISITVILRWQGRSSWTHHLFQYSDGCNHGVWFSKVQIVGWNSKRCHSLVVYEPTEILYNQLSGHDEETHPPVFSKSPSKGFNH